MKKAVIVIIFFLTVCLSGCASWFEAEVYEISDFDEESYESSTLVTSGVSSFDGIKDAINKLVLSYQDEGVIKLKNYEGNLNEDISRAIKEVKNTPLGSYCVDDIYYEPSQIISYYEANIRVIYKRTKEQVDKIIEVNSLQETQNEVKKLMQEMATYIVLKDNSNSISIEGINEIVEECYYSIYTGNLTRPVVEVNAFPENGDVKIFEVQLSSLFTKDEIKTKTSELSTAIKNMSTRLEGATDSMRLFEAVKILVSNCKYTDDKDSLPASKNRILSETAYGAIINETANSEGYAMAVMAICDNLGINCCVVKGKLNDTEHYWNIVELDEEYQHIDASMIHAKGFDMAFLKNDFNIPKDYKWDKENYPKCDGTITYMDLISEKF